MKDWINKHRKLIIEYSRLKNKKKEITKQMSEISKQLNKLDEELIRGKNDN